MNDIEKIAHQACYSTDYATKNNGQQFFFNLCQTITPDQLLDLINNYSPTTLFITMEYIHKVLNIHRDIKNIFLAINQSAQSWFHHTATFIRNDKKVLEHHVQKSLGRTLGGCLKSLYMQVPERQWVKKVINQSTNPRYRLYLEINFIEQVSVIDRQISFLQYRSLVYTFQELIIPAMMDHLLPFFQSVREQMEINELSSNMESTLTLDTTFNASAHTLLFTKNQQKFSALVFKILNQIICFNYNLTYSQYQSETPIQNCLICFPSPVSRKIVSREFVTSLFYVVQKLAMQRQKQQQQPQLKRTSSTCSPNKQFLDITLECISKIALTKLSYINATDKQQFIRNFVSGVIRLLKIMGKFSDDLVLIVIQTNTKLLINIELYELKKYQEIFLEWIQLIRETIMAVITNMNISIQNALLLQCLELTCKIVGESVSPYLKDDKQKFKEFGLQIFNTFIISFLNKQHELLGYMNNLNKIKNLDDVKKGTTVLFKKLKTLIVLDLKYSLPILDVQISKILHSNTSYISISNIYFLMGDLCEFSVFERNILYQDPNKEMFPVFGKIIATLIDWVNFYRNTGQSFEIIEIAVLIFIEKLCSQLLLNFINENGKIKITGRIYQAMKDSSQQILQGQQLLLSCFNQFALSLKNGAYTRVSYTFDVLGTMLLKFKWGLKRESFKSTQIAKNCLQLCLNLSQNNFEGQLLKLRKKLFKIITNISFDDILDDYHQNIDRFIQNLGNSFAENPWKMLYDLTGICEAIDIPTIYRYFIVRLMKKLPLNTLFDYMFDNCNENLQIYAEIIKLQLAMVENRSHKLSGGKAARINYSLHDSLMKYWIVLLQRANNDSWENVLFYLYKIFIAMIKGRHLNFFLLQRVCSQYGIFIKVLIRNLNSVSSWINLYPQLDTAYRELIQQISEELLTIILCSEDGQLIFQFNSLFDLILTVTGKSLLQLKTMEKASQYNQKNLETSLATIGNIFKYIRDSKKMTHKTIQIRNITEGIIAINMKIKFEFLVVCFQFGIQNKGKKHLQKICYIIQNMDFLCFGTFQELIRRLGITNQRKQTLSEIWGLVDQNKIENNEESIYEFGIRIKQWFKKCDSDTMVQPEY